MAKTNQTKQADSGAQGADSAAANVTANESGTGPQLAQESALESTRDQLEGAAPIPTGATKIVPARVLAFCGLGEPNDVIEIDEEVAATMPGIVDTTPEAVAYALSTSE